MGEGAEAYDRPSARGTSTKVLSRRYDTCDIVVEGDIDLDCSGDQVLNRLELREIVLALHIVPISNQHACNESS